MEKKVWYQSKTIWLVIGQLMIVWASYFSGEAKMTAVIALSLLNVGNIINRYYTSVPMKNGKNRN